MYRLTLTNSPNRPTSMQVHPLAVHQSPPGVGVDVTCRNAAGEHLYSGPGVVLESEARIDDGSGSQVLRSPAHARKLRAWDGEDRTAAVQLRIYLEAAAHFGPVVLGYIASNLGGEVSERCWHCTVLG